MQTRSKFYVSSREDGTNPPGAGDIFTWAKVKLNAAYSPDPGTENHRFWKASPNGGMTLSSKSFNVDDMPIGSFFYVDVQASTGGAWKLTKLELAKGSNTLQVTLSGPDWTDTLTVGIDNQSVWPLFLNRLGDAYDLDLVPTTREGS